MTWLAEDTQAGIEVMLNLPRVAPAGAGALAAWMPRCAGPPGSTTPGLARVLASGPRTVALRGGRPSRRHHPRRVAGRASAADHVEAATSGSGRCCAPWPSPTTPGSRIWTPSSTPCWSTTRPDQVMALGVRTRAPAAGGRAATTTGRCRSTLRCCARSATPPSATCSPAACCCTACSPASRRSTRRHRPAIERMAPHGREFVRLPWTTPQPVPEALRAIVNRSTAGQAAPALPQRAHACWAPSTAGARRMATRRRPARAPARPSAHRRPPAGAAGARLRVQRVRRSKRSAPTRSPTSVLHDPALSFELLRTINTAQVRGTQIAGNGPVLTLRRAIALIGVDGMRRGEQPAPLARPARRRRRRACSARSTGSGSPGTSPRRCARPATTREVVYLVAALQNLGRLLVRYHFAEEARRSCS